ncbi:MAG: alpha-amylase [Prevotellaceae bacterium]|jgi:glycosidase|nr:alpha-amylase [Prevotellaceae bacterium]
MKTFHFLLLTIAGWFLTSCGAPEQQVLQHPAWSRDAVIYEVNVRQYTPEGTFNAFAAHLPRLKDLGVDILWFMPIHPIGMEERKGLLGSYYSVRDYKAVNTEFGTLDDFKQLVNQAHDMGFKVIIDWVANHTSRDAQWINNEGWYLKDSTGRVKILYDWTDVAELNYDNPDMRRAMTDAMLFWMEETDVDGFRCDVAVEVPVDFWETAVTEMKAVKPGLFMLAEAEEPALQQKAFDMYYAWDFHAIMNKVAQGKETVGALRNSWQQINNRFPSFSIPMFFTSNHDENSWNGTEFERMGDAAKTFAALTYILPGMPLIYNGQEAGFNRRLEFFIKDEIDWTDAGGYFAFYKTLNQLRKNNPALHSQPAGGALQEIANSAPESVFACERSVEGNRVVAVFNLSNAPQQVAFEGTTASDLQNGLLLQPWEYKIYIK